MSLLRFEIKKLFVKRSALIVVGLFILLPLVSSILYVMGFYKNIGSAAAQYEFARQYEGAIRQDAADKAADEVNKVVNSKLSNQNTNISDPISNDFYFNYSDAAYGLGIYMSGNIREKPDNPFSLAGISRRMDQLKNQGKADSYEYKSLEKNHNMLKASGAPGYYYITPWKELFELITVGGGFFFITFLIMIIVAPVFSNEYSTGMDSIILSCKNGRKKIVTAKLTAAMIFSFVSVLLFNLVQLVCYLAAGGTYGWNRPLKSMSAYLLTPYDITMLQYFVIQLGLQLAGCTIVVLTIAFLSSRFKSPFATFFAALLTIFYPMILVDLLNFSAKWLQPIYYLSVVQLVKVHNIFKGYMAFNIFGSPILYPYLLIPLGVLFGVLMVVLTYRNIKYREVC